MSKLPAMQFFTSDWLSDSGVRSVSYAARGLWMDMLCLMSENDPRGFLKLNGKPVSADQLARMTGGQPDEVSRLLTELETAGVFSTDRGIIYSRRIVRDEEIRTARSHCGAMGGRPKSKTKAKAKQNITPSSSSSSSKNKVCIPRARGAPIDYHLPEYQDLLNAALEILHALNTACGKNYPDTYRGVGVIMDRLQEGKLPGQFTEIVRKKLLDPDFNRNYLRPETLFAEENFDKYLFEDEAEYGKRSNKPPRRKAGLHFGNGGEYPDDTPR
jgi:uncharacterized phage protein (TIGR02220 family)